MILLIPYDLGILNLTTIVACLLVLSCSLLLFFFVRNRQRRRELLHKTRENKVLLSEVHHRVRNNLQLMYSLLRLQSAHVENLEARQILKGGEYRLRSMALIHEHQLRRGRVTGVDMKAFFQHLLASIFDLSRQNSSSVKMSPVFLDLDTAIPLGLLINELLQLSVNHMQSVPTPLSIEISLNIASAKALDCSIQLSPFPLQSSWPEVSRQLIDLLLIQLEARMKIEWNDPRRIYLSIHEFALLHSIE